MYYFFPHDSIIPENLFNPFDKQTYKTIHSLLLTYNYVITRKPVYKRIRKNILKKIK